MTELRLCPLTLREANGFVAKYHRHHKPAQGHRFSIGVKRGEDLVGVCIVGRPVARKTDYSVVAEVTRLCTDGTRNACSILYAAAARAARAMGFQRIQTFILASELGTSLKASGWRFDGESAVGGRAWTHPEARQLLLSGNTRSPDQAGVVKHRYVKDL